MHNLKICVVLFLAGLQSYGFSQIICNPDGNVMIFSNYEGGILNIDVDVDIPNLKIGICTYEVVEVNITGVFASNITGVIFAGFEEPSSISGVDPALVTIYSTTTNNIAICNYLGDILYPGLPPIVNCMAGAEGCAETATGGGNSTPQIVQFFLAEFGPGSVFYAHYTDYSIFPIGSFNLSDGGNCCIENPVTDLNPIYVGGAEYNFLPDTLILCDDEIILDISFYPVVWGDPLWSTGEVGYTITVDAPGTYSFTMTDYCHYDPDTYLTDTVVIIPCNTIIDTAICDGDIYTLPDGSTTTDGGTYDVILIAADGSDSLVTTNLTVHPVFAITMNDAICDGEIYILPDGSSTTLEGTYVFNYTSVNGCDSIVTLNLIVSESFANTVDAIICSDENYTLPDGIVVNAAGIYITGLITVAGCDSIITTNLIVNESYNFLKDTTICLGESVILPDGSIINTAGTYLNNYSTIAGCDSNFITNVVIYPTTDIIFTIDNVICLESAPILLDATPSGGVFSGSGVIGDTFDPAMAGAVGIFSITYEIIDINGCSNIENFDISVTQNFADAGNDTTIFDTGVAEINGSSGGDYTWDPTYGLTCTTCATTFSGIDSTITYILNSVDANGCIASDSITIFVLTSNENIFVPNTFTPNGDGVNDIFNILGAGINSIINFAIYDRWGELIFISENTYPSPDIGWNGTFKNANVNEGVYVYSAEIELITGRKMMLKGNVTLIR